jgi:hypothetical protein
MVSWTFRNGLGKETPQHGCNGLGEQTRCQAHDHLLSACGLSQATEPMFSSQFVSHAFLDFEVKQTILVCEWTTCADCRIMARAPKFSGIGLLRSILVAFVWLELLSICPLCDTPWLFAGEARALNVACSMHSSRSKESTVVVGWKHKEAVYGLSLRFP